MNRSVTPPGGLPVRVIEIQVRYGKTANLGNYESERYDAGITLAIDDKNDQDVSVAIATMDGIHQKLKDLVNLWVGLDSSEKQI